MMRNIKFILLVYLLVNINFTFAQESDEYQYLMLFSNILNHIKSNYLKEVPSEELFAGAINGVFQKLDPHTIYLSPERLEKFSERSEGFSSGLGIEFEIINNEPTVVSVIEDSPADSKNIRTGDVLTEVNSEKVPEQISSVDLAIILSGQEDTKVKLKFKRGLSFFEVILRRENFDFSSIPLFMMIEPGIGYIKCSNFSLTTKKDLLSALKDLEKDDMKALILDLRNNPGGILQSSIEAADLFLPAGKKIVYTSGRKDVLIKEYFAEDKFDYEMPMVILINNGTASASEVLTGALQDNGRAKVIGVPSFGKGLIQNTFLLDQGGAILMTIGEYRTPSGKNIQRNYSGLSFEEYYNSKNDTVKNKGGIQPDVLQSAAAFMDSAEYSEQWNEGIRQKAVSYIQAIQPASKYEKYQSFTAALNDQEMSLKELGFVNSENDNNIRKFLKSKIAGMVWGEKAQLFYYKDIDLQLQAAINILKTKN